MLKMGSRTLPMFLRCDSHAANLSKNRVIALDFLRGLSEQSNTSLQETCVLAWGQIAR